jgi:2-oxoglutarate ferredoxin oxidoreductase subunit alpha
MTPERILTSGNEAAGEAAARAGCRLYFGYPITPQNELTAYMAKRMPELGGVFIQAESELAAINMCYGAAATGHRVMTSSSSPGISLKMEGISYIAGAELPVVIINVMRGGPGLGNIEPAQGDYFQATKGGGHGDYRLLVLAPWNPQEFADMTGEAFELADFYRNPVMVLADGQVGQMMEPVAFRTPPKRDLPPKDWAITGAEGRRAQRVTSFFIGAGVLAEHCRKLQAKYERMRCEARCEEIDMEDAELALVAYGTCARVCMEIARLARKEGLRLGLLRPQTLWPFPADTVRRWAERRVPMLVVEMNMGQMVEDVRLTVEGRVPVGFVGRSGGGAPPIPEVLAQARAMRKGAV